MSFFPLKLVLVTTILVLGRVVGLVEVLCAIVSELSDLVSGYGNLSQAYNVSGFGSDKGPGDFKALTFRAVYNDEPETCDCDENLTILCFDPGEKSPDPGDGGGDDGP